MKEEADGFCSAFISVAQAAAWSLEGPSRTASSWFMVGVW